MAVIRYQLEPDNPQLSQEDVRKYTQELFEIEVPENGQFRRIVLKASKVLGFELYDETFEKESTKEKPEKIKLSGDVLGGRILSEKQIYPY